MNQGGKVRNGRIRKIMNATEAILEDVRMNQLRWCSNVQGIRNEILKIMDTRNIIVDTKCNIYFINHE